MKKNSSYKAASFKSILGNILSVLFIFSERFVLGDNGKIPDDIVNDYGGEYIPPDEKGNGGVQKEVEVKDKSDDDGKEEGGEKKEAGAEAGEDKFKLDETEYSLEEATELVKGMKDGEKKKIDGQEQTKEELMKKFKIEPDEETEEIKLGDQTLTLKELADLTEKAEYHYGKEAFEKLPKDLKIKVLQDRLNLDIETKTRQEKSQQVAKEKRKLDEEIKSFNARQAKAQEFEKTYQDKIKELKQKNEELTTLLEKKPDDEPTEAKTEDLKKQQLKAEIRKEDNEELIKQYEKRLEGMREEAETVEALALCSQLQKAFPELETIEQTYIIRYKAKHGIDVEKEEYTKAKIVNKILQDYLDDVPEEEREERPIDKWFELERDMYPVPAAGVKSRKTLKEVRADNIDDIIKKARERQSKNPPPPGGGGSNVSRTSEDKSKSVKGTGYEEYKINDIP